MKKLKEHYSHIDLAYLKESLITSGRTGNQFLRFSLVGSSGVVVNLERTTEAIRQSLFQAERVAGVKVERVVVGVGGPHLKSVTSHGLAAIRRGR